jgi:membrane protein CcdC involved in cytochrome C biogenesis
VFCWASLAHRAERLEPYSIAGHARLSLRRRKEGRPQPKHSKGFALPRTGAACACNLEGSASTRVLAQASSIATRYHSEVAQSIMKARGSSRKHSIAPIENPCIPTVWQMARGRPAIMRKMFHPNKISIVGSLLGLAAVLVWRIREGRTAVSVKKIVIPPLGMATGFSMFIIPAFRIPWTWGLAAFLIGAVLLAYPLLKTSRLVQQGDAIMMQRSAAFFSVILVLAAVRILARGYFDTLLTVEQSGALFFVLAFGMIVRWRLNMLREYRKLTAGDGTIAVSRT